MGSQITTSVTIINSGLKGYQALTLTNYTGSAVSAIAAGSSVEIAGAFFLFSSEESVTGLSAIATAATAYVALMPSGTAGSQIVSASWTATAPTWSESKQGWYTSTDSVIRVIGGGVKTGAAAMEPKFLYGGDRRPFDQNLTTTDAVKFATVNTGQGDNELYDMNQNVMTTSTVTFSGLTVSNDLYVNSGTYIQSLTSSTVRDAIASNGTVTLFGAYFGSTTQTGIVSVAAQGWGDAVYHFSLRALSTYLISSVGSAFSTTDAGTSVALYYNGGALTLKNRTGASRKFSVGVFQTNPVLT